MSYFWKASALCVWSLLMVQGCEKDVVAPQANQAPQTQVQASPPRGEGQGFAIDFFFTGTDVDGSVDFFEWRVVEGGENLPPWTRTEAADLTLWFPDSKGDVRDAGLMRTFQVRAVDDSGLPDPTAAAVDFTPLTLVPQVRISIAGVHSQSCMQAGQALTFRWEGRDEDSKSGTPEHVRYMVKKYGDALDPCLLRVQFENGGFPISNDDFDWSQWIRYDAALDSGRVARFAILPPSDLGTSYVFVVQARDIDGVTSRGFVWGEQVAHVMISGTRFPLLSVTETSFGQEAFVGMTGTSTHDISPGQTLEFSWTADASSYFGEVVGYRYGWDLIDANDPNDPGWEVDEGDWSSAPGRSFQTGTHSFVVQAIDRAGHISRATYVLTVVAP